MTLYDRLKQQANAARSTLLDTLSQGYPKAPEFLQMETVAAGITAKDLAQKKFYHLSMTGDASIVVGDPVPLGQGMLEWGDAGSTTEGSKLSEPEAICPAKVGGCTDTGWTKSGDAPVIFPEFPFPDLGLGLPPAGAVREIHAPGWKHGDPDIGECSLGLPGVPVGTCVACCGAGGCWPGPCPDNTTPCDPFNIFASTCTNCYECGLFSGRCEKSQRGQESCFCNGCGPCDKCRGEDGHCWPAPLPPGERCPPPPPAAPRQTCDCKEVLEYRGCLIVGHYVSSCTDYKERGSCSTVVNETLGPCLLPDGSPSTCAMTCKIKILSGLRVGECESSCGGNPPGGGHPTPCQGSSDCGRCGYCLAGTCYLNAGQSGCGYGGDNGCGPNGPSHVSIEVGEQNICGNGYMSPDEYEYGGPRTIVVLALSFPYGFWEDKYSKGFLYTNLAGNAVAAGYRKVFYGPAVGDEDIIEGGCLIKLLSVRPTPTC